MVKKFEIDKVYRYRTTGYEYPYADVIVVDIVKGDPICIWSLADRNEWSEPTNLNFGRDRFKPHPDEDGFWARYCAWKLINA
jgi:hypothetical protein